MSVSDDSTPVATHHTVLGLHRDRQGTTAVVTLDRNHVQTLKTNMKVATLAIIITDTAAQRRLGHRRGPHHQKR
jgi:hypothetical protein